MRVCDKPTSDTTYEHPEYIPGHLYKIIKSPVSGFIGRIYIASDKVTTCYKKLIDVRNGEVWSDLEQFGLSCNTEWEDVTYKYCLQYIGE